MQRILKNTKKLHGKKSHHPVSPPGPNAADASLHLHPAGVSGGAVGGHVHPGVAGFPLCPHPHRPRQDVPAASHLHHQRDGLCKSTTGGRGRRHHLLSPTGEFNKISEVDKQTVQ